MKKLVFTISLAFFATPFAHACFFCSNQSSTPDATVTADVASTPSPQLDAITQKFNDQAVQTFAQLQTLMSQQNYTQAYIQAKALLDQARMTVGIDLETKYQTIIPLPQGTLGNEYKTIGMSLAQFTPQTQDAIMTVIENLRGGAYLDLLNLLKRAELIYIEAFAMNMKANSGGQLLQMDIDKIKSDISTVIAIPILVQDPSVKTPLLIFDSEVASSDQNYIFNRELIVYLMSDGKELGLGSGDQASTEDAVQSLIQSSMQDKKQAFVTSEDAAISGGQVSSAQQTDASSDVVTSDGRLYIVSNMNCYPADSARQAYGNAVDQAYCNPNQKYTVYSGSCFPADPMGQHYGNAVDDAYCQASN